MSSFRRFSRTFGIVVVDLDLVEERIDRRTQFRHRGHGGGEIFFRDGGAGFGLHLIDGLGEGLLLIEAVERGIRRAVEWLAVLLLLDAENVCGALGAGEQVLAVVGIEEFAERFDAADDHQEIVLAFKSEYGIDEVVARALLAKLDFQAIGEERKKIVRQFQ